MVLITDARLKTIANGGHVANGNDIRPYTDETLTNPITGYEKVFYDGVNGILEMHVKVASLASSTTPFVLGYGDASLVSDGSSPTCWSNGFVAVYHLKDGSTLSLVDSLGLNNGTNNNGVTAAAGKVDGAANFASASNQFISSAASIAGGGTQVTHSGWVKGTSFPNSYNFMTSMGIGGGGGNGDVRVKSNGKLACFLQGASGTASFDGTGTNTLSAGTFYLLHMTYDSVAGMKAYVNASLDATAVNKQVLSGTNTETDIGRFTGGGFNWNGVIDEVRFATIARSQDWITTEYNNQNAPSSFLDFQAEVAFAGGGSSGSLRRKGDRNLFGGDRSILDRGYGPNRRGDRGQR